VGDRHVVERMRKEETILGGEQSGHLIFLNYSTTGDGILAALQILKIMREKDRPVSEIASLLIPFPQKLINVPVKTKKPFEHSPEIQSNVERIEQELGATGRVLLRYSGTEAKARVMVEGEDPSRVETLACDLAETLRACLG